MVLNIATLFFRETGGPGEKPSYLSPSDHQISGVFFFRSFLFFLFPPPPLFSFFDYFLCPIFFIYFFHISFQKCQCCSLKLSINISNITLHRYFVGFFSFPAPPFSLFDNPVRHVLFFGLSAPLSFVFLSRSLNTYCLMVCISEYVSEDKLFMCRI